MAEWLEREHLRSDGEIGGGRHRSARSAGFGITVATRAQSVDRASSFRRWHALLHAAADPRDLSIASPRGRTLETNAAFLLESEPAKLRRLLRLNARALPKWAEDLLALLSFLEREGAASDRKPVLLRQRDDRFLHLPLCFPVVRFAADRLNDRASAALQAQLAPLARRKLRSSLAGRLLRAVRPAAETALGKLEASWPNLPAANRRNSSPIAAFFEPSPEARLILLLQEFPALARLAAELAGDWEDGTREFLARLQQDRRILLRTFGQRHKRLHHGAAFVRDLEPGLGDPHCHGRSVTAVLLKGGGRLIYKPRDCRGEWEWRRLAEMLHHSLRPYAPAVLRRRGWGWVEFVAATPCRDRAAACSFYRRAGAAVCMAHLLRASDLHRGNVIAAGSQPVVIDLESLWSGVSSAVSDVPLALTGLLQAGSGRTGEDFSAFSSAQPEQGDEAPHRPRLWGKTLRARDFIAEMEEGYCAAAVALLGVTAARRKIARQLRRVERSAWRQLHWSTESYSAVREDSLCPELLRDGTNRFLATAKRCAARGANVALALDEAAALLRLDIPCFKGLDTTATGRSRPTLPSLAVVLRKLPELRQTVTAL